MSDTETFPRTYKKKKKKKKSNTGCLQHRGYGNYENRTQHVLTLANTDEQTTSSL